MTYLYEELNISEKRAKQITRFVYELTKTELLNSEIFKKLMKEYPDKNEYTLAIYGFGMLNGLTEGIQKGTTALSEVVNIIKLLGGNHGQTH